MSVEKDGSSIERGNDSDEATITQIDPRTPPDGGVHAWLCVFAAFICQFSSFGFLNACGVFQYQYQLKLLKSSSSSAITWITTIQIFLMFVLGGIIGKLVDVFGPRRIIIPASIVSVGGICALSAATKYWHVFLAQGLVYGIGASGLFLPGIVTTGQWFAKRRGLATGIVVSGSSVGGVIFPIMTTELLNKVGFASAVRWIALFLGILLAVACLCISAPYPPRGLPKKEEKTNPEETKTPSPTLQYLKNWTFVVFTSGSFLVFWGLLSPINYLPLMAQKAGFSSDLARYVIAITNGASIPGRILPAHLSDRYGQFNMMTVIALGSGLSVLAFWLPLELADHPSHAGIIVFAALYGFVSGGFVSMMSPCIIALDSTHNVDALGARLGSFMIFIALAALTGLPIQGAIQDNEGGGFVGLMIFSGTVMLVGGIIVAGARMMKGGWRIAIKV